MRAAVAVVVLLAGCGYDWTVVPKPDASAPAPCASDKECPQDWFCAFPDHLCGKGTSGTCKQVPPSTSCAGAEIQLVCTCDGRVAKTPCQATAFGVDLSVNAVCKATSADVTQCGYLFCDAKTTCTKVDVDGGLDFRCAP
jgi:hypothetical protein